MRKRPYERKRQWGTERRIEPLAIMHDKPSTLAVALSRVAIVLTIVFWGMYLLSVIFRQFIEGPASYHFTLEAFSYSLVVSFLTFSALMYLVARQGALQRFSKHVRVPRAVIDAFFAKHRPSIRVLVPSYEEEPEVIRKTLISAALQEYPNIGITLLLDDNPFPDDEDKLARLTQTRQLPEHIEALLRPPMTVLLVQKGSSSPHTKRGKRPPRPRSRT